MSKSGGLGACLQENSSMTAPFTSLENTSVLENVPLAEAKDHD